MSMAAHPYCRMLACRILHMGACATRRSATGASIPKRSSHGDGGVESVCTLTMLRSAPSSSSSCTRPSSTSSTRLRAWTQPWTTSRYHLHQPQQQQHLRRRRRRQQPQELPRGVCAEAGGANGCGERVTSTENATVKHLAKLVKNRAYREDCGSIVVAGASLLEEIYGSSDSLGEAKVLLLADDAAVPAGMHARRTVHAPEHVMKKAAGLQSVDRVDAVAELAMPPLSGRAGERGGLGEWWLRNFRRDGALRPASPLFLYMQHTKFKSSSMLVCQLRFSNQDLLSGQTDQKLSQIEKKGEFTRQNRPLIL